MRPVFGTTMRPWTIKATEPARIPRERQHNYLADHIHPDRQESGYRAMTMLTERARGGCLAIRTATAHAAIIAPLLRMLQSDLRKSLPDFRRYSSRDNALWGSDEAEAEKTPFDVPGHTRSRSAIPHPVGRGGRVWHALEDLGPLSAIHFGGRSY